MTKKNKMWDNSNLQEEIVWGNIQLPGLSDEKLLTTNWNYVDANRKKAKNEQFKEKLSESVKQSYIDKPEQKNIKAKKMLETNLKNFSDPEYKKWLREQRQLQAKDPGYLEKLRNGQKNMDREEWKKNLLEGQKKRNENPTWKENIKKSKQEQWRDPAHREKMLRVHSYAIKTPDGVFAGLDQAHVFYNNKRNFNNGRKWVKGMMKKDPKNYYKISWEEYDKLKK